MIKSFSGQVVFCFALRRAISTYVGENRLSQYICLLFLCSYEISCWQGMWASLKKMWPKCDIGVQK